MTGTWRPRDTLHADPIVVVNAPHLAGADSPTSRDRWSRMAWVFRYDDVDASIAAADMELSEQSSAWRSATIPTAVASSVITPGNVATEAAAVLAPVLVAMGERDVIADPKGEPRAYLSATSVDLFIWPRMGHMHNFAGTRELLWERIDSWARWVGVVKARR